MKDARGNERQTPVYTSRGLFPDTRRFRMREWSVWNRAESVSLAPPPPIDERVQPEFQDAARRSMWPHPLSLAGIRIVPAKDQRDNEAHSDREAIRAGRGDLVITGLSMSSIDGASAEFHAFLEGRAREVVDEPATLFPDDLTLLSGPVRLSLEANRGYQGPCVWRREATVTVDRAKSGQLFADRIGLPRLPAGIYRISTKAWRLGGPLSHEREFRLHVAKSKATETPSIIRPIEWSTGRPDHVFPCDATSAELNLDIAPRAWPGATTWHVRVVDWMGTPVLETTAEKSDRASVLCDGLKEGVDYFAVAEWRRGTAVIERSRLHFGVASRPQPAGRKPPDGIPTMGELWMSGRATPIAEHWGSLMTPDEGMGPLSPDVPSRFDAWLDEAVGLKFSLISFTFGWGEIEPLPGVYRWSEIERRVNRAAGKGCRVLLTPTAWADALEYPLWAGFAPAVDQHGRIIIHESKRQPAPSILDPLRREERLRWTRAVADRFLDHPAVIGYRTKPFVYPAENKPEWRRTDYAAPMAAAFSAHLASIGEPDAALPPLMVIPPMSPSRFGPDLSPAWRRFMDFRTRVYGDAVGEIMDAIRSVDPVRSIHIYRSSMPNACEPFIPRLADGGGYHDEGGPFYFQRAMESLCLQTGVPYTNEGHQFRPPSKALADGGFFYGSIYDRGWSWLYRWNIEPTPDARFHDLPNVLAFIRDSMPAVHEWTAARGDEPEVLVFGSRADGLLSQGRQGFYSDIGGLDVFTSLFVYHQIPAHFANEHADWVDLSRFRAVVAAGEVMTRHGIDRIARHAASGGRVIVVGDAGRYCAEEPEARDALARALLNAPHVLRVAAADRPAPEPGAAFRADGAFDEAELKTALDWAGIRRLVSTDSGGFECVRKRPRDGDGLLVAVYRRWPGSYDNVWFDEETRARWGTRATVVTVHGVPDGVWRVEKIHRDRKVHTEAKAAGGELQFQTDPATVGELQLFRLSIQQ